jgi:hypothetical protein
VSRSAEAASVDFKQAPSRRLGVGVCQCLKPEVRRRMLDEGPRARGHHVRVSGCRTAAVRKGMIMIVWLTVAGRLRRNTVLGNAMVFVRP